MIKFSLLCGRGHEFESWFQSGEAFETQSKSGRVSCPLCQATDVTKAIMAPAIASKSEGTRAKPPAPAEAQAQPEAPAQAEGHAQVALLDPRDLESRAMITAFRKRIYEEAEDVGMRFAEEVRKIHDGRGKERPIHGQTDFDEARALIEEGIEIFPVPSLPDEFN
ncbi:MAG: DUF1178 family protein [Methylocella sp.]